MSWRAFFQRFAACCCVLLAALAWAQPPTEARLGLHVGIARESVLPLASVSDDGVLRGLAIDLARLLSDELGMELRLKLLPQRDLIDALNGGGIDVVLSTLPAAELRAQRLLPSLPLLETGQLALIREPDLDRYSRKIDVLTSQGPVGFEQGTTAARVVHERMPLAQRVPFWDAWQALLALRAGEIDILVLDALLAWNLLADPGAVPLVTLLEPLSRENLVWVVREKDVHLHARINSAIKQWATDTSLARLISRWIPLRIESNR